MKKNGVALLALGCLSAVFTASCAGTGEKAPEAPAAVQNSYSPPELQTKDWEHYLYGNTTLLIREKKYDEALTRLVWYWDHILEYQPAMYGVRLSFCLNVWKELADQYPPAMTELKQIRDASEEKVLQGDAKAFADASNINRILDESKRTVELFRKLDQTQPTLAKAVRFYADHTLIENGEYALALKYGPTQEVRWNLLRERMKKELSADFAKTILSISDKSKEIPAEKIKKFQEQTVRYFRNMEIAPLVKLCNATGKQQLAGEIEAQSAAMIQSIVGDGK